MRKNLLVMILVVVIIGCAFSLSSCAFFEFAHDKDNVVDMGGGSTQKYVLVQNDNPFRPVNEAYFEIGAETIKYFENGTLKKEGELRSVYYGLDEMNPLTLVSSFGSNQRDYLYCYTEDAKDDIKQFSIKAEGYHVLAVRQGGVPVRDYHLSEMPYAFGTYVKEGCTRASYQHEKVKFRNVDYLEGEFVDEHGNKFFFVSNSYTGSSDNSETTYNDYTTYMRYENNQNHTVVEGTIYLSHYDDWELGDRKVSLIYVMHGSSEPAKERGVSEHPDYEMKDFEFAQGGMSLSFTEAKYFDDQECTFDPADFVAGVYVKVVNQN